jgi:hypothetical protein
MARWQRAFRYLWRINAVLILVATSAITFGVGALLVAQFGATTARTREAESGPLASAGTSDPRLFLGQASVVPGTVFMRADLLLHHEGGGFSSGGYAETRNILFIDPGEKHARWLLPDDKHCLVETSDVATSEGEGKPKRTVATVALVKASDVDRQTAKGQLLLFGPSGTPIVQVSEGVRALHVAALSGEQITVLYERDRQLVMALFAVGTLVKQQEQTMPVPALK